MLYGTLLSISPNQELSKCIGRARNWYIKNKNFVFSYCAAPYSKHHVFAFSLARQFEAEQATEKTQTLLKRAVILEHHNSEWEHEWKPSFCNLILLDNLI